MADKRFSDVKIKGKKVATKGSVAKHNDSMHMQFLGTIKFQNNLKKDGEGMGETVDSVKVAGMPVAVFGSLVTTCNDIGARDKSKILASYAA